MSAMNFHVVHYTSRRMVRRQLPRRRKTSQVFSMLTLLTLTIFNALAVGEIVMLLLSEL